MPRTYGIRRSRVRTPGGVGFERNAQGRTKIHHNEAWYIRNRRPEKNLELPNVAAALQKHTPLENVMVDLTVGEYVDKYGERAYRFVPELGVRLGGGAYGTALEARYSEKTMAALRKIRRRSSYWIDDSIPSPGAVVCIKMQVKPNWQSGMDFVKSCLKEASFQRFLCKAPAVTLPMCAPVRVADFVPKYYRGGVAVDRRTSKIFFVTTMAKVPGEFLEKFKSSLTAMMYVKIERAVVAMWLCGICHSDLHGENLFWDPVTKNAKILDFGFATMLTPELAQKVRVAVTAAIAGDARSLAEVWFARSKSRYGANVQAFVNRVQYSRNPSPAAWYNSDAKSLLNLYGKLSATERARVPALRKRVWGFGTHTRQTSLLAAAAAAPLPTPKVGQKRKTTNNSTQTPSATQNRRAVVSRNNAQATPSAKRRRGFFSRFFGFRRSRRS